MEPYRRILLKLSGEALSGKLGYGFDSAAMTSFCSQIRAVHDTGVEIAIVIGGGNIFRGLKASSKGMDRSTADSMGMLATMINGLALRDALEQQGLTASHMSSLPVTGLVEPFVRKKAVSYLSKGHTVIFSGGTGNPYFSTDTAASLRAAQIDADVILKGTKVDGVYEGDPVLDPSLKKFDVISYTEVLKRNLGVMDATAIAMCRENHIPIIVFNLTREGALLRVVRGEQVGTIVKEVEHG
ncbi:UMP kinase [bacterium]|nr:UMP kinase [bacterium]